MIQYKLTSIVNIPDGLQPDQVRCIIMNYMNKHGWMSDTKLEEIKEPDPIDLMMEAEKKEEKDLQDFCSAVSPKLPEYPY